MDGNSILGKRNKKSPDECIRVIEETIFENKLNETELEEEI